MTYPDSISQWLSLPWHGIVATILGTIGIYAAFLLVTRLLGTRMLASLTTFDTLMALLFGSVIARTTLGPVPTLTTGITALLTLVILHFTLGKFANTRWGDAMLNANALILVARGQKIPENMRRTNTTHRELLAALRGAGIRDMSDVQAVIMEPSGKLSIYRAGAPINPAMLDGVKDAELIIEPQKNDRQ